MDVVDAAVLQSNGDQIRKKTGSRQAKVNNLLSQAYPSLSHFQPRLLSTTPHTFKMPISKKDRIHREHKKAEAAGTRVPVNPNGTPKKAPKATSICVFCKKELVSLHSLRREPRKPLPPLRPCC